MDNAAIELIKEHTGKNNGASCPACDWRLPRWIGAQVVAHAQVCEPLRAAVEHRQVHARA
jgi:hypothetical protein